MDDEAFVEHVADRLCGLPYVAAVTLGGSRAEGIQRPDSDWDFSLYYRGPFDPQTLRDIGWPGGVYRREVVLADADLAGDLAPGIAHLGAGRRGLVFAFPLGEGGAGWRLLATRPVDGTPAPPGQDGPALPPEELQGLLDEADFRRIAESVLNSSTVGA